MSDVLKKRVLLIGGAIVAAITAAVIIVLASPARTGRKTDAPSDDRVKIELRAKPVANIHMNRKNIGTTPKTIVVPRGKPLQLEALFTVEKIGLARPAKKVEIWRQVKEVVPDAEQSVDFRIEDATKIEEGVEKPDSNP